MATLFYAIMRPFAWAIWLVTTAPRRIRRNRRYRSAGAERGLSRVGGTRERRYRGSAVVCAYYRQGRSLARLLDALDAQGLDVCLVANRSLTPEEIAAWSPMCVDLLERVNYGGDWGAYKAGVRHVLAEPRYRTAPLVLANDSVYYLASTAGIVRDLLASPSDVCATTVNKEFHPHVQSFLLALDARVVESGVVEDFFRRYRVRYSKSHAIRKGEIAFSARLRRAGYALDGLHGGAALTRVLVDRPQDVWLPELYRALDGPLAVSSLSQVMRSSLAALHDVNLVSAALGLQMERRNATHTLALTLARGLGTPIKLDLVKGEDSALEIVTALEGYADPEDLEDLSRWFANSESPASFKGLHGLYHHCGVG